jgi:hypothetical protein
VIIPTITISPVIVGTIDDIEFEAYRQQPHPLLGGGCWEIIFRKKTTPGMFSFGIKNLAIFWSSHTFAEIGE